MTDIGISPRIIDPPRGNERYGTRSVRDEFTDRARPPLFSKIFIAQNNTVDNMNTLKIGPGGGSTKPAMARQPGRVY
jgi:hypothetical protein